MLLLYNDTGLKKKDTEKVNNTEGCLKRKLQAAEVSPRKRASGGIVYSSEPRKARDEPAKEQAAAFMLNKLFRYSDDKKGDFTIPGLDPARKDFTIPGLEPAMKDFTIPGLEPAMKDFTIPGLEPAKEDFTIPGLEPVKKEFTIPGLGPVKKDFTIPGLGPVKKDFTIPGPGPVKKNFTIPGLGPVKKDLTIPGLGPVKKDFTTPGLKPVEEKKAACVLIKLFKNRDEVKENFTIPGLQPAVEKTAATCVLNTLFQYSDEEKGGSTVRRKRTAGDGGEAPEKRTKYSSESSSCPVTWDSDSSPPYLKSSESGTKNKEGDANLTEEEKIYKMSSSANQSQADFDSKYEVLRPLGKGGYGMVCSGLRISDNLPVAIKYIDAEKVNRQEVTYNGTSYNVILEVAFMLKTAGLKGEVGQSAAVALLDWYSLDDKLILVMERPMSCMDLQQYLHKCGGKLCEDEAKDILRQLVDAAIELDSKNIFHRDIKPQNVLIQVQSGVPRVHLIDFGCASFSSVMFNRFHGTRLYAPPESFRGAYQACPTTVWQLGALFYTLLHGMYKFNTDAYMKGTVEFSWRLSKESRSLLKKCLVQNPAQRATLQQLQQLLAKK